MEQEHGWALAFVAHRELDAVAVDPPHDRAAYVVWRFLNSQSLKPSDRTGINHSVKASETRERVVVRMAGDSGDGMQLAGSRFTDATAVFGNDLATLPDFPAEIRAPAGTVAGVSAFQIHFASRDILTPGDTPDVLVAMNPAALKANLRADAPRRDDPRQRGRVHACARCRRRATQVARWRTGRSTASRSSGSR